jgi:hypothetical protein
MERVVAGEVEGEEGAELRVLRGLGLDEQQVTKPTLTKGWKSGDVITG